MSASKETMQAFDHDRHGARVQSVRVHFGSNVGEDNMKSFVKLAKWC